MLKASEVEWLNDRENASFHYSCQWCSQYDPMRIMPDMVDIPCMWHSTCHACTNQYDYKDAAEFEALVAAELTRIPRHYPEGPCDYGNAGMCTIECALPWLDCRDARLKWARLKVEEDFDGKVVR